MQQHPQQWKDRLENPSTSEKITLIQMLRETIYVSVEWIGLYQDRLKPRVFVNMTTLGFYKKMWSGLVSTRIDLNPVFLLTWQHWDSTKKCGVD